MDNPHKHTLLTVVEFAVPARGAAPKGVCVARADLVIPPTRLSGLCTSASASSIILARFGSPAFGIDPGLYIHSILSPLSLCAVPQAPLLSRCYSYSVPLSCLLAFTYWP